MYHTVRRHMKKRISLKPSYLEVWLKHCIDHVNCDGFQMVTTHKFELLTYNPQWTDIQWQNNLSVIINFFISWLWYTYLHYKINMIKNRSKCKWSIELEIVDPLWAVHICQVFRFIFQSFVKLFKYTTVRNNLSQDKNQL